MVKHNEIEENISELSVLLNKIQTYIAGLECGKRIEECVAREDYSSTDLIEIKKIPLAPVAYTRYRCPCNPGAFIERYSQLQSLMEKHQLHRAGPLMAIFHDHYTQFDYKDADIEVCVPIAEKALIDLSRVYSFQKSLAAFRNMFLLIESEQFKEHLHEGYWHEPGSGLCRDSRLRPEFQVFYYGRIILPHQVRETAPPKLPSQKTVSRVFSYENEEKLKAFLVTFPAGSYKKGKLMLYNSILPTISVLPLLAGLAGNTGWIEVVGGIVLLAIFACVLSRFLVHITGYW